MGDKESPVELHFSMEKREPDRVKINISGAGRVWLEPTTTEL
jgi:hypothetical protein